ncbi:MAG TPA: polysaccharide biosynthesis/export family protein [Opitutaceae bacterium]|nr:polysaccharide biosynthesis/export family protein [Opitutaceae bacterium]
MKLTHADQPPPPAPLNAWTVLDLLAHRWLALACWTLLGAAAGAALAFAVWGRSFTSTAQLVHYEPSTIDDTYHPRALVTPSLIVMLQSPALFSQVGSHLQPPMSEKELARHLQITLDRNNDVATVTATAATREQSIDLVNRYCDAAIAYTREMQRAEAVEAGDTVTRELGLVENELAATRAENPAGASAAAAALALAPDPSAASDLPKRIQAARDQLDDLLVRYTDAHPLVREQRARLAALEQAQSQANAAGAQAARTPAAPAVAQAMFGRITPEEVAVGERLRSLESNRAVLLARQRAIQPFRDNPPGYFSVLSSVTANPTFQYNHRLEMVLCGCLGALFALVGAAVLILVRELMDNRLKTRADVQRVTGLPVLATLGEVKPAPASDAEQDQGAFRAWTAVQSRLRAAPHRGVICGITSARRGEGRSTWVDLLARGACQSGFRVLTITTQPSSKAGARTARAGSIPVEGTPAPTGELAAPDRIAEQLMGPDCPSRINLPLSGWVWNLEHRRQWQAALDVWGAIEHVAIFIELPPASETETVLLAENIPNLLWVADAGASDAAETHADLENLRCAGCNLVGAVLNREHVRPLQERYSRWFGTMTTATALLVAGFLLPAPKSRAADPVVAVPATFSVTDPSQRAGWQQHLTLGPGDLLRFQLYGSPDLTREDVAVDPDGRVSYLEAENIMATGLTVDELRDKVNTELGKFRRTPQVFITPVAYRSKHYYLLGSVAQRGVYPLDRPITIIEAVARAHGFETGVSRGNVVETADFSHSFLSRDGHRLPIDFEKLFLHGDLSQNIPLEPGDYLYFPGAAAGAVYVLGEVRSPGAAAYDTDANVIGAIASRGGFSERAWKQRVLVVRGSREKPEAFAVNTFGILEGKGTNFALQPGDIVYVSSRPWIKAEEILDRAASAFVESAVITWTSLHVGGGVPDNATISAQ